MKKKILSLSLTLLLGLFSWNATAATGWYQDYIKLNVNGAGVTAPTGYKWIGTDPSYGSSLVAGLGNVTSLVLDGADMKYWGDGADRTGGSFFYEVKSADGVTTYKAATEVIWTQTSLGGNDFQGISSGLNVNLLAGIPSGTACKLTVWAKSWGSGGDSWLNNGGGNYVATFTASNVLVSGSVSQDGGYATLGAAITAIGLTQASQNIVIKIGASTTESSAITIGAGTWTSLKIYPTTSSLTCSTTNISLSGAKNVTIDGRMNQTGTPAVGASTSLTLSSTSTTASVLSFDNDAQTNTIQYCNIKIGAVTTTGGITFGATAATANGNGLNVIDHNLITSSGGTYPVWAIYATGNTTNATKGNQITNNYFTNFLAVSGNSIGIYILGNATANINDNYTISGNSMFGNVSISSGGTRIFMQIGAAGNAGSHTITGNYIGGQSANCGGSKMTQGGSVASHFLGIGLYTSGSGTSLVQNNTIKNINWTSYSGSRQDFNAIQVLGTGAATISGNVIGNNTTSAYTASASIIHSMYGSTAGNFNGINISTTGAVTCTNNQIGSIKAYNGSATGTAGFNLSGINKSAGGTIIISNNIIGSLTAPNSINDSITNTTLYAQSTTGIIFSGSGTCTISNNNIANLTNRTSVGYLYGINMNGAGTCTANGNLIHSNVITGYTGTSANIGISSGAGTNTISNNIIRLGDNNACEIRGINDGSTVGTSTSSYHNTIYIGGSPTTGTFNSSCEFSTGPANIKYYKNNIFVNARSNNGASGSHYALYLNTTNTGTLGVDGNDYYVSGTGGVLCRYSSDRTTLLLFQQATSQDAASVSANPTFANAGATTAESYVPSSLLITGVDLSAVPVASDYNGVSRTATPTMGAHDYRIWNGTVWNTAPTTDYNAKIDGTFSGVGFACRNLVLNAGKQLGITSGTLAVANNFTILSDATNGTGTFIDNGGTLSVVGTTTVNQSLQHYLSGTLKTWYLTPPVASATPTGMSIIKSYDEPTFTWSTSLTTMNAKVGYQVVPALAANNISFTGALNTGNQNISLTSRTGIANKAGFNLIGNPYPSYLDWTLVTANGANTALMRSTTMWYRTKSDAGTYNFWTVNGDGVGSPNGANSKIPPMQAFWVRANADGGTLALTNDMRSHAPVTDKLLKAPAAKNTANTLVRLQVSNGTNTDEAVLYFSANASNGLDGYDAPKMSNENVAIPEIYTTVGTEQIVINGMNTIPLDAPIGLGFVAGNASSFSLTANEVSNLPSGVKLILKDNVTNAETDLTDGIATYQFSPVVTSSDRFSVIFRTPGAVTTVENPQDNSILVYNNAPQQLTVICNDLINLGSMVSVYNALGQKLISQKQTATSMQIAGKFIPGVYVVKVNNTTKKVIIK